MIVRIPSSGGVMATVSVEYQPQDPTWTYGGQSTAYGTVQKKIQGLADFTGTTTAQRQPAPVIQADALALTVAGTET